MRNVRKDILGIVIYQKFFSFYRKDLLEFCLEDVLSVSISEDSSSSSCKLNKQPIPRNQLYNYFVSECLNFSLDLTDPVCTWC